MHRLFDLNCKFACLLAGVLLLFSNNSYGTHAAGADLTYKCLGGQLYQVDATFYRDCGGSAEPGNVTITYKSAVNAYSRSVLANKVLVNNGVEITFPCATSPSTCNGGISTGMKKWIYRTIVTLPYGAPDWVFSYRVCCRNCTVTTIQSPCAVNSEIYVEATLNNQLAPENSSPGYSNMPIAFVCLGQNFNYNQGVFDIDGDSLAYELIKPKISATAEVTWLAPSTTSAPLASSTPFEINPLTGDINFTPSAIQVGILAIRINEFRNGHLIGSTIRDIQVYTQNCFNSIPVASGINGSNNYVTSTCAGQQLCFNIQAADADSNQNISYSIYNPITGSTINQSTGNRPSLQFCWTPADTDVSRHPYIFIVTIKDDACPVNGVQSFSYTVFVNGPLGSVTTTNPGCGSNNGTATVLISNIPNCNYHWNTNPVQQSPTASGLGPGTYEVAVTDQQGCSNLFSATLTAPVNSVSVTCSSSGVISCQSGNIGTANAQVSGGNSPFTYLWSNGMTTSSLHSLTAGTYGVTVTDVNGCSATDSTVITSAVGQITAQVTQSHIVSCLGDDDGVLTAIVSGGTQPYTYQWNTGAVSDSISNLVAGTYTVTVTDANKCSVSSGFVLSQPSTAFHAGFVSQNVTCYQGMNGALNVFVTGGTSPYSYQWNNGATTTHVTGLPAGNYSVTITDANGCNQNFSSSIIQPASALTIGTSTVHAVSCYGGNDGEIVLQVTGGNGPYNYLWSHGATTMAAQNLEAGSYSITVTDANGCSSLYNASVSEPAAPLLLHATVAANVSCSGDSNGSLDVAVTGGTSPYHYLWNTGFTGPHPVNLSAGNYNVVVTDANLCTANVSATITEPSQQVGVNIISQQVLCYNGNNGALMASATGGNGIFLYQWSNGSSDSHLSGLAAGTYTVTVTDGNLCSAVQVTTITQPTAPLIPTTSTQPPSCSGVTNGAITLTVTGGTTPYSFLWSNGSVSQNIGNLQAGIFTVTITDANGCNAITSETVTPPAGGITATVRVVSEVKCYGGSEGALIVQPSGGQSPFTYLWSNGSVLQSATGMPAGNYSVTVTDNNGCSIIKNATVTQPASAISLTGVATNSDCIHRVQGRVDLIINGGGAGLTYLWSNGAVTSSLWNTPQGIYTVTVTDNNGCTASGSFRIYENEFNVSISGKTTICSGDITKLVADSLPNTTYQWFYDGNPLNGATGMQFSTPAAGFYSVSLTNTCGTFISDDIELEVKTIDNVSVSNKQIICPPETAQLQASGGSTYEWSPDSYMTFTNVPDPFVSPLSTTNYAVLITNEFGCKTTLTSEVAVVCDSLLVPTGFSPSSDGVNDGYVIDGIEKYPGNKLWVYNRWGKLVFKAHDYNNSWDGSGNISGVSMGQRMTSGTYYFILDLNDQSKPRAGYLIIRGQ